jgi:hypothetical protein
MIAKLLESGWAEMVYEDDEARLLKIREQKGEPPPESKDDAPPTPEEVLKIGQENNDANANATVNATDEETEDEPAN